MSSELKRVEDKHEVLVPRLRFPEFFLSEKWVVTLLAFVAEIKGRIGYRGYTTDDIVEKGKGAITLSPSNFDEFGRLNFDRCTYITWEKYEESPEIMLEVGQTVLVKTASVGKTAYVESLPEKSTVNPQIVVLKPKEIVNRFLAYTIAHQNTQIQIDNCVGAGAIPNISQDIISKIQIVLPPDPKKNEQHKIADCLSSLDELIAAQSRKVELLKTHKKGLMQQLFPREGETLPRLRFDGYEGEWEVGNLGQYSTVLRGGSPRPIDDYLTLDSEGFNWLKIGDVSKESKYVTTTAERVRHEALKKTRVVNPGDFILSNSMSFGRPYILQIRTCIHDGWIALTNIAEKIDSDFLYYQILAPNSQSYFIDNAAGSGVLNLNAEIIKALLVHSPTKPEQKKIAACLSELDDQIAKETQRLESLKVHKKGLMQGLFPSLSTV